MIFTNKESGKDIWHAIKLYNVETPNEAWNYIHEFSRKFCELKGYDEYGIEEFIEGDEYGKLRNYASVVFLYQGDIKEGLSFDVDNFVNLVSFEEVQSYDEFTFFSVK